MYLAGKAVNDQESISIAIKTIDGLCNMEDEEWMLESPTLCYGYAGLFAIVNAMYIDTDNTDYMQVRKKYYIRY